MSDDTPTNDDGDLQDDIAQTDSTLAAQDVDPADVEPEEKAGLAEDMEDNSEGNEEAA